MIDIFGGIFVTLIIAHASSAGIMPIRACPGVNTIGELVHIIIPACDAPPCLLLKGSTYRVEIDFEVSQATQNLTVVVTGNDIVPGIELPWNGVSRIGCNDMYMGRCPLNATDYVTYGVDLTVLAAYPNVDLTIKWRMHDERNDVIWCFMLPARIRPPSYAIETLLSSALSPRAPHS